MELFKYYLAILFFVCLLTIIVIAGHPAISIGLIFIVGWLASNELKSIPKGIGIAVAFTAICFINRFVARLVNEELNLSNENMIGLVITSLMITIPVALLTAPKKA